MFESGNFTKKQRSALNRLYRLTVVKLIDISDYQPDQWINEFDYIWNAVRKVCQMKEQNEDIKLNNRAYNAATKWCNDTAWLINETIAVDHGVFVEVTDDSFDIDGEGNVICQEM